jgi:NTP pyrophosphatase (non-canonical NTP hydrolase)
MLDEKSDSLTWETYCEWRRSKCPSRDLSDPVQRDEEITQATLELIGEVAELNLIFIQYGYLVESGRPREELIDECGDIVFCSCWVAHAWTQQPPFVGDKLINGLGSKHYSQERSLPLLTFHSGILANKLKKQKYQGKKQDKDSMSSEAQRVIVMIANILQLFNSSLNEALRVNIAKLNKRFPDGYTPGGGIR